MDFSHYNGKKISTIFRNDTLRNFCHYSFIGSYPGCIPGITLTYNNYAMSLRILFIQKCPNAPFFKRKGKWSKEKINRNAIIRNIEVEDILDM